jgi:hypothetical protein
VAVGGPGWFVSVALAVALSLLGVEGMVAYQLTSVPGSVQHWRDAVADIDAEVVGVEAEQIEEPVGGRPYVVGGPTLANQVLNCGCVTAC